MTCKNILLYQSGELSATDRRAFEQHLKGCRACQEQLALANRVEQAIFAAPAAPEKLVEQILARTTRRPTWWIRWRSVLAGGIVALLIAVGISMQMSRPKVFSHSELVAYMSENEITEYTIFWQDLDLLENSF